MAGDPGGSVMHPLAPGGLSTSLGFMLRSVILAAARSARVERLVETAPIRKEAQPRARPVWDVVRARVEALLSESRQWTGGKQRLTATRLHELLVAEGAHLLFLIVDQGEERAGYDSMSRTGLVAAHELKIGSRHWGSHILS